MKRFEPVHPSVPQKLDGDPYQIINCGKCHAKAMVSYMLWHDYWGWICGRCQQRYPGLRMASHRIILREDL